MSRGVFVPLGDVAAKVDARVNRNIGDYSYDAELDIHTIDGPAPGEWGVDVHPDYKKFLG